MRSMKRVALGFLSLLLAGCGTSSVVKNSGGGSRANWEVNSKPGPKVAELTRYHYETVTEYFDGGTRFLVLVPDAQP
jgi:hypothetical protein